MTDTTTSTHGKRPRVFRGGARPIMPLPPQGLNRPTRVEDMRAEMERFMRESRRRRGE